MKTKNNMRKKIITFTLTAAMVSTLSFASFALKSEVELPVATTDVPPLGIAMMVTKPDLKPMTQAEWDNFSLDVADYKSDGTDYQNIDEYYDCLIENGLGVHMIVASDNVQYQYSAEERIAELEAAGVPYTIEYVEDVNASAKEFAQPYFSPEGSDAPPADAGTMGAPMFELVW